MATISGQTFSHKDTLKNYGAKWNSVDKVWYCADATAEQIKNLNLAGLVFKMSSTEPKVETKVDFKFAAELKGGTTASGALDDVRFGDQEFIGKFGMNPRLYMGFATLGEFVDYVAANPDKGSPDDDFAGGTMRDAIKFARNGWSDGIELAEQAAEIIAGDHVQARVTNYSVAGGRVNVGRLLSGDPMHMKLRKRQPSNKSITLFVDTVVSAFVDPVAMIIRAAAIAAMVDVLEQNGYSAEIVAVAPIDRKAMDGRGVVIATKVKTAGQALNLADVVFALGHPTYLRQLIFSATRQHAVVRDMHSDMGIPREMKLDADRGEFYIGRFNASVTGGNFKAKVRAIFPHIVPADFPINLTE